MGETETRIITEPAQWAEINPDGCPYNPSTPEARVWRVAQRNGVAAASWVFDGNTSADTYAWYVRGIDQGDPEVMDALREPSLSGEFAGDYSETDLMAEIGWVPGDGTDMADDLADQFADEVSAAFWAEIERAANAGAHAGYPHEAGRLPGCPGCEARCHCSGDPGETECVFEGDHEA